MFLERVSGQDRPPTVKPLVKPATWQKIKGVALGAIALLGLAGVGLGVGLFFMGMAPAIVFGVGGAGAFLLDSSVLVGVIVALKRRGSPHGRARQTQRSTNDLKVIPASELGGWDDLKSGRILKVQGVDEALNRQYFLEHAKNFGCAVPLIAKSIFVPDAMVNHLMRHKADKALGVKDQDGTQISNMEGAMHTFVTPIVPILMGGDDTWRDNVAESKAPFAPGEVRQALMSAAVQPDFENHEVMFELVALGDQGVIGRDRPEYVAYVCRQKDESKESVKEFREKKLKAHMIYHLTANHALPARDQVADDLKLTMQEAKTLIGSMLKGVSARTDLERYFLSVQYQKAERLISLEVLYKVYVEQLSNELRALESLDDLEGYILTIDPPSIFAKVLGGASLMNALQALALQEVVSDASKPKPKFKILAFNNYVKDGSLDLFQQAMEGTGVQVMDKQALYDEDRYYKSPLGAENYVLVLHNNSDAFGQNIEIEGYSSLDGVIGSISNAAVLLKRDRPHLTSNLI